MNVLTTAGTKADVIGATAGEWQALRASNTTNCPSSPGTPSRAKETSVTYITKLVSPDANSKPHTDLHRT